MNELCFTTAVLNLNKFLNIDFNKQKLSSSCAQKVLCLDYSNLEERLCLCLTVFSMRERCSNRDIIGLK